MWVARAWATAIVLVLVLAIAQCGGKDDRDFAPPGPPDPALSTPVPDPSSEPPIAERVGEQLRVVWEELKQAGTALRRGFERETD